MTELAKSDFQFYFIWIAFLLRSLRLALFLSYCAEVEKSKNVTYQNNLCNGKSFKASKHNNFILES